MFILFHLLTGVILGYLLADRLGTRAVVLPCIFGALLPDLVDKPVGILLFNGAFGEGRIFIHTFLFLLVLLLAGVVVYRRYGRPALLGVGLGVASHQALDVMWVQPRAWLFPLLGPTQWINTEDWFVRQLLLELSNPFEWASALFLLVLLLPVLRPVETAAFATKYRRFLRAVALASVPLFSALGLYLIATDVPRHYSPLTGWKPPCYTIMYGLVLLLAAYASYRLSVRLASGPERFSPALDSPSVPDPQD